VKKNILITLTIILGLFAISWSGCKSNDVSPEEFIIQIDSIVHADTITFGETLSIKFYGEVGPNGCYSFGRLSAEYIPAENANDELLITSYGNKSNAATCPEGIVYMNGDELIVSDIPAGNLDVKAMQPDGSAITQHVFIKE